ncbi:sensor histidine kinase [Diaminobutyricibacter sp. McL0618]|uniref:sensor histidine kinase n=1 Tax=Leifsonia sp. McL0618 TaxID=3415677 RepID=UPI003CE8C825
MKWLTRWRGHGRPVGLVDVVAALAVTTIALIEWWATILSGPAWAIIGSAVAFGLCVLFRRRAPMWATLAVATLFPIGVLLHVPVDNNLGGVLAPLLVIYSLAASSPLWRAIIGGVVLFVCLAFTVLMGVAGALWATVLIAAPIAAGQAIQSRRTLIDELRQTQRDLQSSRDEQARIAVESERIRIARELHDVVAHAVSIMVVQATAAETAVAAEPAKAMAAMSAVQRSGRQALEELRRMLGMLRPEAGVTPDLAPQPGLASLDSLARELGEAGVAVRIESDGAIPALAPGLDLASYRIAQEALTNVLRHAPGAGVTVGLAAEHGTMRMRIVNGRSTGDPVQYEGSGNGLAGMRERAELYGGHLEARPTASGGFEVLVTLPIEEPA